MGFHFSFLLLLLTFLAQLPILLLTNTVQSPFLEIVIFTQVAWRLKFSVATQVTHLDMERSIAAALVRKLGLPPREPFGETTLGFVYREVSHFF